MKKFLTFLMTAMLLTGLFIIPVNANNTDFVYVSISDENGEFVLAKEPFHVTDMDNDGTVTIHDALLTAHQAYKQDGYAATKKQGILTITKLWGVSDHTYGCLIDGSMVYSLHEPLSDENHIQAFIYTDIENLSDAISYFSKEELTFANDKEALSLYAYTRTPEGNLMSKPVAGAEITVNGEKIGVKTDKNGRFTLSFDKLQENSINVISANSEKILLVPPILTVDTSALQKPESSGIPTLIWFLIVAVTVVALVFVLRFLFSKRKKS